MFKLGLAEITLFFTTTIICIIFVVTWIVNAERKRKACKEQIKKLKNQIETIEREKFILAEKIENLNNTEFTPQTIQDMPSPETIAKSAENEILIKDLTQNCEALEEENKRLKQEFEEAKNSLEEVYRALVKE